VNRIGAFGINRFTEYGQLKKNNDKKERETGKNLQKQFFRDIIVV
jgi:hypothetical protein